MTNSAAFLTPIRCLGTRITKSESSLQFWQWSVLMTLQHESAALVDSLKVRMKTPCKPTRLR